MERHLEKKVGGQGLDPIQSSLSRWNAIMGALSKIHELIGYIDIESLRVEQQIVSLNLIVSDASNASKVQKKISELPAMEDLEADPQLSFGPLPESEYGKVRLEWREKKTGRRR